MAKAEVASAKNLYGILSTGCFCYVMQVLSFFSLIFSLPPKLKLLRPLIVVIIFSFMNNAQEICTRYVGKFFGGS